MKLNDEEQDILARQIRPGSAAGVAAPDQGRRVLRRGGFRAGDAGAHHGRHRKPRRSRRALAGRARGDREGQRSVRVPTITDPRGTDFSKAAFLGQTAAMLDLERRAIAAFVKLGVTMTDTCINYQTIQAPTRNEHVAFGDTGVVIYSNSVCGALSNFEGGPSALAAGLTGRTPRYGFHLPEQRRATLHVRVDFTPASLNEWGALGAVIGRIAGNYWAVPVIEGIDRRAAVGSAQAFRRRDGELRLDRAVSSRRPDAGSRTGSTMSRRATCRATAYAHDDVTALQKSYHTRRRGRCRGVFGAAAQPVSNCATSPELCDGQRFKVPLLAVTSPQVKPDCDRAGYTARIEQAGGTCSPACASISRTRARSPRRTAGSGSRPTARSWSISWAATAIGRCWPRWRPASTPR